MFFCVCDVFKETSRSNFHPEIKLLRTRRTEPQDPISLLLVSFSSQHTFLNHNRVCMSLMAVINDNPTYLFLWISRSQSSQIGNFVTNVSLIISDMLDFPFQSDLSCRPWKEASYCKEPRTWGQKTWVLVPTLSLASCHHFGKYLPFWVSVFLSVKWKFSVK